jgi:hypothetical protein
MNSIISRITAVGLLAIPVFAVGCSAAAGPGAGENDGEGPPPGSVPLGIIGNAGNDGGVTTQDWLANHGGTGGTPQAMGCPDIVGITGNWGDYIDELSLLCSSHWGETSIGAGHGYASYVQECPTIGGVQYVWVGLQGRAHTYVDALGMICASPNDNGGPNVAAPRVTKWTPYPQAIVGGGGGDYFYEECPANMKINWMTVRGASWLDAIEPYCSPI